MAASDALSCVFYMVVKISKNNKLNRIKNDFKLFHLATNVTQEADNARQAQTASHPH